MEIIPIEKKHYPSVANIYAEGLATGIATFETKVPSWESWHKSHLEVCRIAGMDQNHMLGWAALTSVSTREVYRGVAELSVYVAEAARGKGVGKLLITSMISQSELNNFWTLQSGIFSTNKAIISLHEKCGFRIIGYREKIARRDGIWMDNTLMERRSKVIGIQQSHF